MDKVYWVKNASCKKIETDGYVGVSKDPHARLLSHLRNNERVPSDAWVEVVFEGPREECFRLEGELRPTKNIGWNRAIGGAQGFRIGFVHSNATKKKLKKAWTKERKEKAAIWKAEQNRLLVGQKRPAQSAAMSGELNPMFGKQRSAKTKRKISEANIGREPPNKQELFCIFCKKRAPLSILKKYHEPGKKHCINR